MTKTETVALTHETLSSARCEYQGGNTWTLFVDYPFAGYLLAGTVSAPADATETELVKAYEAFAAAEMADYLAYKS